MTRRTNPTDAGRIQEAEDLEDLVRDKRAGWRADGARARRRQRRYKNLLTRQIALHAPEAGDDPQAERALAGAEAALR